MIVMIDDPLKAGTNPLSIKVQQLKNRCACMCIELCGVGFCLIKVQQCVGSLW